MENYINEVEEFVEKISDVKRAYMEGNSDRKFIRDVYIKWRQLKSIVDVSGADKLDEMDKRMEEVFEESFEERPNRNLMVNSLTEFIRFFRKNVLVERKIAGKPIELDWEDPISHFETYGITKEFEERVREFLESKLENRFGDNWFKRGIPKNLRKDWREKKEKDKKEAKKASKRIDYASFGHYFEVIKYNWKEVFKEIFEDKEKTRIRFNDIKNLIRNPSAHVRTIDPDEVGHAKYTKRWIENKMGAR